MFKDKYIPWILMGVFALTYLVTFPRFFFSVDELSYVTRAMAFASGQLDWVQSTINGTIFSWAPADYPLGTAIFLTPFALFSKYGIFLSGLVYVSVSIVLINSLLQSENQNNYLPYLIFFLFPPTIYFSRGVMSEMPSLLLISLFVYILFKWQDSHKKYFILGLLTTFSIWFRETNIILCGGLVALSLLQKPKYIFYYSLASILGFIPRVASASYFYETVAYVKQYAPFGIKYLIGNLPLYALILLILLPGGLIVLVKYKERYATSIKLSLFIFILIHLVYEYNSGDHSGFLVSLFYNGRYFIPTLPLWAIVYANLFQKNKFFFKKQWVKGSLIIGTLMFILAAQGFLFKLETAHRKVALEVFANFNDAPILYDNVAYRYLNPMNGTINQLDLLSDLRGGKNILNVKSYLVLSHRQNSKQQIKLWEYQQLNLEHLKNQLKIHVAQEYAIFDGTNVIVFELTPI